jgi:hypothetical protein
MSAPNPTRNHDIPKRTLGDDRVKLKSFRRTTEETYPTSLGCLAITARSGGQRESTDMPVRNYCSSARRKTLPAPEKKPYKIAKAMIGPEAAVVIPKRANSKTVVMRLIGGMTFKTPNLSARKFGMTRPGNAPALISEIYQNIINTFERLLKLLRRTV